MKGTFGELATKCKICGEKITSHRTLKIEISSTDGTCLSSLEYMPPLCDKHNGREGDGREGDADSVNVKISWSK